MLKWKWWDKTIEEIDALIPVLTSSDLKKMKEKIKTLIGGYISVYRGVINTPTDGNLMREIERRCSRLRCRYVNLCVTDVMQ